MFFEIENLVGQADHRVVDEAQRLGGCGLEAGVKRLVSDAELGRERGRALRLPEEQDALREVGAPERRSRIGGEGLDQVPPRREQFVDGPGALRRGERFVGERGLELGDGDDVRHGGVVPAAGIEHVVEQIVQAVLREAAQELLLVKLLVKALCADGKRRGENGEQGKRQDDATHGSILRSSGRDCRGRRSRRANPQSGA